MPPRSTSVEKGPAPFEVRMDDALAEFLRYLALEKNASADGQVVPRRPDAGGGVLPRARPATRRAAGPAQAAGMLRAFTGLAARAGLRQDDHRPPDRGRALVVPLPVPAGDADGEPGRRPARAAPGQEAAALLWREDALAGCWQRRRPDDAAGPARPGHPGDALLRRAARQRADRASTSPTSTSTPVWPRSAARARRNGWRFFGPAGAGGLEGLAGGPAQALLADEIGGSRRTARVPQQERHPADDRGASAGCWRNISPRPASIRAPARTRCGTASPRTCSTAAPTSAACRSCSATAAWRPRRFTPT